MGENEADLIARAAPRRGLRVIGLLALLGLALPLGACQTDGVAGAGGRTLAFDSIDGPPQPAFEKLVGGLSSEAEARRLSVVSRNEPAAYRVKGYLAMHVEKGQASCAYAWDVYDAGQSRVVRIAGEEPAGRVKGKADWAACDDAVMARIAEKSMASLAETFGGSAARAPAQEPQASPAGTPVAQAAEGAAPAPGALSYAAQ